MTSIANIIVLSGCPGTGKTTLSRALCQQLKAAGVNPLHLATDVFFSFPVDVISPDLPAAKLQNQAVSRAVAHAAMSFAEDGYMVVIDGVIGPWMLPHYLKVWQTSRLRLAYIVLKASQDETLRRAQTREDGEKFSPDGVLRMHRQFVDLKVFEPHAVETDQLTEEETLTAIRQGLGSGRFTLTLNAS